MGGFNNEYIKRYGKRAEDLTKRSNNPMIQIGGEAVTEARARYKELSRKVNVLTASERKERRESDSAFGPLALCYDAIRTTVLLKRPGEEIPSRSYSLSTFDDLLETAEDMETLLLRIAGVDEDHPIGGEGDAAPTGERWAITLLGQLQPPLVSASKEYEEATAASEALQKAQAERTAAKDELELKIRKFRRLVRDVHGSNSKEYLRLTARSKGGLEEEEGEEGETGDEGEGETEPTPGTTPTTAPVS